MPMTAAAKAWAKANPGRIKAYQAKYDAKHRARRLKQKRDWWRKNGPTFSYGSRSRYRRVMRKTGGLGYGG